MEERACPDKISIAKSELMNVHFLVGIINTVNDVKRNTTEFFLEGCPIESLFTQFFLEGWKTRLLSSKGKRKEIWARDHARGQREDEDIFVIDMFEILTDFCISLVDVKNEKQKQKQKRPCRPSPCAPFALLARP